MSNSYYIKGIKIPFLLHLIPFLLHYHSLFITLYPPETLSISCFESSLKINKDFKINLKCAMRHFGAKMRLKKGGKKARFF